MPISSQVRSLMRPSAAALEPYDPAFSQVEVNLSANENTYGLPPAVASRVAEALAATATNRYPRPMSDDLRAELAFWHGVSPSRLIVGNGGDELLFNLFLAFGGEGRPLVVCPPTFSVYKLYAELVETPVVEVPLDPDTFEPREDELLVAARTANLVVLTSPNNPTGTLVGRDLVRRACEACPGLVLVDQAYAEFSDPADVLTDLLDEYPNLLVLRTLSKAFALAGARIGYVMGAEDVISALTAVRQPYSVNVLSQAAALVAVRSRDELAPTIRAICGERERLSSALAALPGVTVWPSASNFLLVRVRDARRAWLRLRDEWSILVRDFSSSAGLADCLRITVGTPEENDRVVAALSAILGNASFREQAAAHSCTQPSAPSCEQAAHSCTQPFAPSCDQAEASFCENSDLIVGLSFSKGAENKIVSRATTSPVAIGEADKGDARLDAAGPAANPATSETDATKEA